MFYYIEKRKQEGSLINILILNSSPRKGGNSEVLCQQFAKGAEESDHSVCKIDIRERKIAPCMACNACRENHICVIKDDMEKIIEEMRKADVIVLSSPVYFYSLSAQMKLVIDRTYSAFMDLKGKKLIYMVTAADPQHEAADAALDSFRGFARCLPESEEKGIIYGTGAWDKGDIYKHPVLQQAYEMGKGV